MMPSSALVVGYSEQLPNELRAYHLMGTSTGGAVLLSRHGATYSAAASEVAAYPGLLERMLGVVLPGFPSSLQERARQALISRWNRDWGVEAANDNGAGAATAALETSPSPLAPLWPTLEGDGSFAPNAAVAVGQPSAAHG